MKIQRRASNFNQMCIGTICALTTSNQLYVVKIQRHTYNLNQMCFGFVLIWFVVIYYAVVQLCIGTSCALIISSQFCVMKIQRRAIFILNIFFFFFLDYKSWIRPTIRWGGLILSADMSCWKILFCLLQRCFLSYCAVKFRLEVKPHFFILATYCSTSFVRKTNTFLFSKKFSLSPAPKVC